MEEFFQAVPELVSAIAGLFGTLSLFLMVLFVWRYGPAIGAGLRRSIDAALLVSLLRDRGQPPLARPLVDAILGDEAEWDPPLLSAGRTVTRDRIRRRQAHRRAPTRNRGYAVDYFARKHGLSREEADRIIRRVGTDREKLNRAAERAKRKLA